jgi:hypothetical protein
LDLNIANLCSVIANSNRDRKKKPQPFTISDFLLKYDSRDDDKAAEERTKAAKAKLTLWANMHNKSLKK